MANSNNKGKSLTGIVVSVAMEGVVVVDIERKKFHRLYSKGYTANKRIKAKDEVGNLAIGDKVLIAETKPISKNVTFKVVRIEK